MQEPIELEVWTLGQDGYLHYVEGHPIQQIYEQLRKRLGDLVDEYFSVDCDLRRQPGARWPPKVHWIACYAVTGGSEGHYVHVDAIDRNGARTMLFLGKTFQGMAHAQAIAAACAEHLGA